MFTALRRKRSYIPLKRYIYGIRRKNSQISLYGYVYGIQSKMKRKIRFRGIHSNENNIYKKQRGFNVLFSYRSSIEGNYLERLKIDI